MDGIAFWHSYFLSETYVAVDYVEQFEGFIPKARCFFGRSGYFIARAGRLAWNIAIFSLTNLWPKSRRRRRGNPMDRFRGAVRKEGGGTIPNGRHSPYGSAWVMYATLLNTVWDGAMFTQGAKVKVACTAEWESAPFVWKSVGLPVFAMCNFLTPFVCAHCHVRHDKG